MARNQEKVVVPDGAADNLYALVTGEQAGIEVRFGYSLELKHGLMGFFPAVHKATDTPVLTFDLDLIADIWRLLEPRESKISSALFAVNKTQGVCYLLDGVQRDEMTGRKGKPHNFLTRERFVEIIAADPQAFRWAPGLIGGCSWDSEVFQHIIRKSLLELQTAPEVDSWD